MVNAVLFFLFCSIQLGASTVGMSDDFDQIAPSKLSRSQQNQDAEKAQRMQQYSAVPGEGGGRSRCACYLA